MSKSSKGKGMVIPPPKVVVFDLDETLGYFCQVGNFLDCLSSCSCIRSRSVSENMYEPLNFFTIMRLFPEIIRPKIFAVFKLLKEKKDDGVLKEVLVYTNNNGGRRWVDLIVSYFNHKMRTKVIDNVIHAFKINGELVEPKRTTHEKTMSDFLSCTQLPSNVEVCFVDDLHHAQMFQDNVLYIRIKPYINVLPWDEMVNRFLSNSRITGSVLMLSSNEVDRTKKELSSMLNLCDVDDDVKNKEDLEIDKIITKRVYEVLFDFLGDS